MEELLKDFLNDTAQQWEALAPQLARFEQDASDARIAANIFRLIHTIAGASGFLRLPRLQRLAEAARAMADLWRDGAFPGRERAILVLVAADRIKFILSALSFGGEEPAGDDDGLISEIARAARAPSVPRPAKAPSAAWAGALSPGPAPLERRTESTRVSNVALERVTSLAVELAGAHANLSDAIQRSGLKALEAPADRLDAVAGKLRAGLAAARSLPAEKLFSQLRRVVDEASASLGKDVEFAFAGGAIPLDRQWVDSMREPLSRLLRDVIAFSMEPPEDRARLGKPGIATIEMIAAFEAGELSLTVRDDGLGLDFARRDEAARGAPTPIEALEGLAQTRARAERLGGDATLICQPGSGASLKLRIPPILPIAPAFVLRVADQRFALPSGQVEEILRPEPGSVLSDAGRAALLGSCPSASLRDVLRLEGVGEAECSAQPIAVKIASGPLRFAIFVDDVIDIADIVMKPLPKSIRHLSFFGGAAILADGEAILALDPEGLAEAIGMPMVTDSAAATASPRDGRRALVIEPSAVVREMIGAALTASGYATRAAASAAEALEIWAADPDFDAVFIDLDEAEHHGACFIRRAGARGARPVLMGMASHGGPAVRARALASRLAGVIGKFDREAMRGALPLRAPLTEIAA